MRNGRSNPRSGCLRGWSWSEVCHFSSIIRFISSYLFCLPASLVLEIANISSHCCPCTVSNPVLLHHQPPNSISHHESTLYISTISIKFQQVLSVVVSADVTFPSHVHNSSLVFLICFTSNCCRWDSRQQVMIRALHLWLKMHVGNKFHSPHLFEWGDTSGSVDLQPSVAKEKLIFAPIHQVDAILEADKNVRRSCRLTQIFEE